MTSWVKDFYTSNKHAILWTVGYIAATWAIMRYMFNFDIFSAYRWHQLMHAHLHGFAGLVFGILILAMVPLYVATTIVIARNNAPLFNFGFDFHIPQFIKTFIKNAFTQTPMVEDSINTTPSVEQEPIPEPTAPIEETKPELIPETVPAELRVAYERARDNVSRIQTSAFDLGNITKSNTPIIEQQTPNNDIATNEMPIPTDFDIEDTSSIIGNAPIFTDLDFDDDDVENDTDENEPQINDVKQTTDNNDLVIKYLTAKSIAHTIEDDVVITDAFAIVSHTDSDFWVADNESWFAAGKIRKSPIASVLQIANAHNVQPILYLGADNIMDIDELRVQWESSGIRVITNLKDLI